MRSIIALPIGLMRAWAWGWLKLRTGLGHGWNGMPLLRQAYENGEARTEHIDAIVYRAKPARLDAIAECDEALTRVPAVPIRVPWR